MVRSYFATQTQRFAPIPLHWKLVIHWTALCKTALTAPVSFEVQTQLRNAIPLPSMESSSLSSAVRVGDEGAALQNLASGLRSLCFCFATQIMLL